MSAGILLSRKRVHEALKNVGYKPTKEKMTAESGAKYLFWKTSWNVTFPIRDEDHVLATWTIADIISKIEKTRPEDE